MPVPKFAVRCGRCRGGTVPAIPVENMRDRLAVAEAGPDVLRPIGDRGDGGISVRGAARHDRPLGAAIVVGSGRRGILLPNVARVQRIGSTGRRERVALRSPMCPGG